MGIVQRGLRHCEAECGVGGDLFAIHGPIYESVTWIGRGYQRTSIADAIDARSRNCARFLRLKGRGDAAAILHKMGNVGLIAHTHDGKAILHLSGYGNVVSFPAEENAVRIGHSLQNAGLAVVIHTCSYNDTAAINVDQHINGVGSPQTADGPDS